MLRTPIESHSQVEQCREGGHEAALPMRPPPARGARTGMIEVALGASRRPPAARVTHPLPAGLKLWPSEQMYRPRR